MINNEDIEMIREEVKKELWDLPNEYSEKLWKNAYDRGYQQGRADALNEIKEIKDNIYTIGGEDDDAGDN